MYFSTLFLAEAQITKKQVIFWPSYGPFLAISRGFWTPIFGNFRKITFFHFSYDFSFFTHFSWLFALHVRPGFFDSLHLSRNRCSPQLSRFNFPTWLSTTFHTHFRTPTFGHFFDPRRNFANFVLFEFAIIQLLKTGVKKAVPGGPPENGHFVHPYFRLHFSPSIWDVSWRLLSSVHHDELFTDFTFWLHFPRFTDFHDRLSETLHTFRTSPTSTTSATRFWGHFLSSRHNFRCFTTFSATQLSPRHHFSSYTTFVTSQLSSLLNFRRPTTFCRNLTLLSPRIATHSSSLSTLSFAAVSYFRLNCAIFWLKTPRFSLKMSHFRRKWPISSEKDTGTVL